MKTSSAVLVIAAGILLLWVVTSNRLGNLRASWNALLGNTAPPSPAPSSTPSSPLPATSPLDQYAIPKGTLTVPSPSDLFASGLPTLQELTYPNAPTNPGGNSQP